MSDLSLDSETMGTTPGSAVVAIGACFFDTNTGQIDEGFYRAIHLGDCQRHGLTIDASTVMWWMSQVDEVRNAIRFSTYPLIDALHDLRAYVEKHTTINDVRPWMRGPSFDGGLIGAAYRAIGEDAPWKFWNERCHRTLTARNPSVEQPDREGNWHNALDDAKHQARWLIKIAETHRARIGS